MSVMMLEYEAPVRPPSAASRGTEPRRVLIVEDDARIASLLAKFLGDQGFTAHTIANGLQVEGEVRRLEPSLVLLDLHLPGLDGIEVCQQLRRFTAVPIIMLTARADELDRLLGLEVGADDYVTKPFSPRELLARMRALLRRAEGRLQTGLAQHGFLVDEHEQRIAWADRWLPLTPVEFRLMRRLLSRPGHVFTRSDLHEGTDSGRVVDSHVKNLRRKVAAVRPQGCAIVSVYGLGYRFDPDASDVG